MPVVIPDGDAVVAHAWLSTGDAELMISTHGLNPSIPEMDAENMADAVVNARAVANPFSGDNLCTSWTYRGFTLYKKVGAGSVVVERPVLFAGTNASETCPVNCSMLVQKRTGLGGRRLRGRMYLPAGFLPQNQVDNNGFITSLWSGQLQTDLTSYLENLVLQLCPMAIHHSTPPFDGTMVTQLAVQPLIATQRRRLR